VPLLGAAALLPFSSTAQSAANLAGNKANSSFIGSLGLNSEARMKQVALFASLVNFIISMVLLLLLIVTLVEGIYFIEGYINSIGFVLDYFSDLSYFFFSMHEKVVLMSLLPAPLTFSRSFELEKASGDKEPCHLDKLNKSEKKTLLVTPELTEILIGLILGDLYVQKQKASRNARLQFKQSTIHKDYLLHLHDLFKEYCGSNPKTSFITLKEKTNRTTFGYP